MVEYLSQHIFSKIKYPCILLIQYKEKFLLCSCKFDAGRIDYEKNILKSILFSHWVYPDIISSAAQSFIVVQIGNIRIVLGNTLTEQNQQDEENRRIQKQADQLEAQARRENNPRKKFDLYLRIKDLKNKERDS